jgi:uncharacterized membrane protein HdeD (DUF308 family)
VTEHLSRYWPTLIARGLLAAFMAITCLRTPGGDHVALSLGFGAYLVADGILSTMSAFGCGICWGTVLLTGTTSFFFGSLLLLLVNMLSGLLDGVIIVWSLTLGSLCFVAAGEIRNQFRHEWLYRAAGAVLLLLGVVLLCCTATGAEGWQAWLGVSLALYATSLVALGLELRSVMPRGRSRHLK